MLIIGCDYHPGFQQIAYVDTETGEYHGHRRTDDQPPALLPSRADTVGSTEVQR